MIAASLLGFSLSSVIAACGGAQDTDTSAEVDSDEGDDMEVVDDVYGAPPDVDEGSGEMEYPPDEPMYGAPEPIEPPEDQLIQPLYGVPPEDWE